MEVGCYRAALQQWGVDDVRVTDDPANVGRRPERLARVRIHDVGHAPLERHGMAAIVSHDAFWL